MGQSGRAGKAQVWGNGGVCVCVGGGGLWGRYQADMGGRDRAGTGGWGRAGHRVGGNEVGMRRQAMAGQGMGPGQV